MPEVYDISELSNNITRHKNIKNPNEFLNRFEVKDYPALNAVLATIEPELEFPFTALKTSAEANLDNRILDIFKRLMQAYAEAYTKNPNDTAGKKAVQDTWRVERQTLPAIYDPSIYLQDSNRGLHKFYDSKAEEQNVLYRSNPKLIDIDCERFAQQMGIRDRFAAFSIEQNNTTSLSKHLALRAKDVTEARLPPNKPFYVMLSQAAHASDPGVHWFPVRVIIDEQGQISMEAELNARAKKTEHQHINSLLHKAVQAASCFSLSNVQSSPAGSKQAIDEPWSCGYQSLGKIAEWELAHTKSTSNPVMQKMAAIKTSTLDAYAMAHAFKYQVFASLLPKSIEREPVPVITPAVHHEEKLAKRESKHEPLAARVEQKPVTKEEKNNSYLDALIKLQHERYTQLFKDKKPEQKQEAVLSHAKLEEATEKFLKGEDKSISKEAAERIRNASEEVKDLIRKDLKIALDLAAEEEKSTPRPK